MFSRIDFGANYAERTKDREMNELALYLKGGRAPVLVDPSLVQPSTSLAFAGIPGVLSYDVMGVINRYMDTSPQAVDQITFRNYSVSEKVTTAFARMDIDTAIGSVNTALGVIGFIVASQPCGYSATTLRILPSLPCSIIWRAWRISG